jgi:hypothetical protein
MPHIAGINKEDFICAVAEFAVGFIAAQEPQAGGELGIQKQLGRQIDDTIHEAGFNQFFEDVSFTGSFGSQRPFCQNKPCLAALFPSAKANSPRKYSKTCPSTSALRALASPKAFPGGDLLLAL